MRKHRRLRLGAAVVLVALTSVGCAAHWAYRQGQQAAEKGEWDLAVARFTRALDKDPKNIGYKIALENARIQASRYHYDEAKKHLAASELEKAADELEIASNYDPGNRSAADDLVIVRERIRKHEEEKRQREGFEKMRAQAEAVRVPVPVLSPRSPVPISLKFQDASLQKIFDSLARIAGVNILFDEGFRDKKYSINVTGVTFEEALDQLTFVNRLFYKVIDENTIIIVPESRQKRLAYNELVLRTFYLQNAEVNDTVNLIKTLARVTTVAGNASLRAITVLGTVDQVAMAKRIIELNDKARGEVIVEVQILEVSSNNVKTWGLDLANYQASMTFSPTGAENEVASGFTSVRAHLLSSLNRADWIVTVPSTVFARFLETDSTVRILASPRLRAAEGKKAELKIGQEVPIPITTFTAGAAGGVSTYLPATSFQYRNVGVNLTLTPEVSATGEITLEVNAEFSLLGDDRNVGSADNPLNVPTFLTRNVTNTLRLRDGETGLIGGLVQGRDSRSFSGAIGMNEIPIIGKLFGNNKRTVDNTEILMSLTPRIVRAPKLTESDLVSLPVGTQEVPDVPGAHPGLFGPEPNAVEPPASAPAPAPTAGPSAAPLAAPAPPAPEPATPPAGTGGPAESPPAAGPPAAARPAGAGGGPGGAPGAGTAPAATGEGNVAPTRPLSVLFSPPEVALRPGETAGLAVVVVGAQDLRWIEVSLAWDPAVAELTDASPGSLLKLDGSPVAATRTIESGRAQVRFTKAAGVAGSGAVVALTFRGTGAGSATLAVQSVTIGRGDGTEQPAPPAPARLVVAP
jgi:general secretion pathway protein D